MSNCTQKTFQFPALKKRKVLADFGGGSITSDGGILLLRQIEQKIKLLKRVAEIIPDKRKQKKVRHNFLTMLKQRVFGIALGYEDLNDHTTLRNDLAFQTGVNADFALASSPTLCRFENQSTMQIVFDVHRIIVEQFIASFTTAPEELILDFDATDDLVHGNQVGKFFHGYYKNYCFLPLYVFCGKHLLVAYLRPSNKDGARHAWAILSLLVKRLRQAWPNVKIIFRGDCGFCRHQMFDWCERKKVDYITGLACNLKLEALLKPTMKQAKDAFNETKEKQRLFVEFKYGAASWNRKRRVIGKAEHTKDGSNPRFIVTTLSGNPQALYDDGYCARGNMENRIKEQQLDLFSDRTSCHEWWSNQFRVLLASLAYIMIEYLREYALKNTEFEHAQVGTIRLKLFKIGATIIKNTRKILFLLSSHYPYQAVFKQAVEILSSA